MPIDTPERRFATAFEQAIATSETFEQAKARMIGAVRQWADDTDADLQSAAGVHGRSLAPMSGAAPYSTRAPRESL